MRKRCPASGAASRLQQEHRDLDAAIAALQDLRGADVIQVQRLKKRKLQLRDRITFIEDQLTPISSPSRRIGCALRRGELTRRSGIPASGSLSVLALGRLMRRRPSNWLPGGYTRRGESVEIKCGRWASSLAIEGRRPTPATGRTSRLACRLRAAPGFAGRWRCVHGPLNRRDIAERGTSAS